LASSYERPDQAALAKLEPLARRLAEELTAWRARAQRAETEAAELRSKGGALAGPELLQVRQRIVDLERENQEMRRRIVAARDQLAALSTRLAFLEGRREAAG